MNFFRAEGEDLEKSKKDKVEEKTKKNLNMKLLVLGGQVAGPFTNKNKSLKKIGMIKSAGMGGDGSGPAMSEGNFNHGGALVHPVLAGGNKKKRKLANRRR